MTRHRAAALSFLPLLVAAASCGRQRPAREAAAGFDVHENMRAMHREMQRIDGNIMQESGLPAAIRASDEIGRLAKDLGDWQISDEVYAAYLAATKSEDCAESRRDAQDRFVTCCRDQKRACESLSEAANIRPPEWMRLRRAADSVRRSCQECHKWFVAK